jgi:hypothetical protein
MRVRSRFSCLVSSGEIHGHASWRSPTAAEQPRGPSRSASLAQARAGCDAGGRLGRSQRQSECARTLALARGVTGERIARALRLAPACLALKIPGVTDECQCAPRPQCSQIDYCPIRIYSSLSRLARIGDLSVPVSVSRQRRRRLRVASGWRVPRRENALTPCCAKATSTWPALLARSSSTSGERFMCCGVSYAQLLAAAGAGLAHGFESIARLAPKLRVLIDFLKQRAPRSKPPRASK